MNINIEEWIVKNKEDTELNDISYKINSIKKCCDKIINSKNLCLNSEYDENGDDENFSIKIKRKEPIPWEDDETLVYETIHYCPFCGEKIEINNMGEIDKTEEYEKLNKEEDNLMKQMKKTDSRKEYPKLEEQLNRVRNQIENILVDDDLNKFRKEKSWTN